MSWPIPGARPALMLAFLGLLFSAAPTGGGAAPVVRVAVPPASPGTRIPGTEPGPPWRWLLSGGLVRIGQNGAIKDDLAAGRVEQPDGAWIFRLRPGLRTSGGARLDAHRFCALWKALPGRESRLPRGTQGPIALDETSVLLRPGRRLSDLPRWLVHPDLHLGPGPYQQDASGRLRPRRPARGPAIDVVESSASTGMVRFLREEVDALHLQPLAAADARLAGTPLLCTSAARRFYIVSRPPGSGTIVRLAPGRLGERVAGPAARPLTDAPQLALPGLDPDRRTGGGRRPRLLVDGGDPLAVALADQLQADLLASGVHLEIESLHGGRFDAALSAAPLALVGFRPVYHDAPLDLLARLRAVGLGREADPPALAAALAARGSRRSQLAEEAARAAPGLLPLLEVDECWAVRRPGRMRDIIAAMSGYPAGQLRVRRGGGRR